MWPVVHRNVQTESDVQKCSLHICYHIAGNVDKEHLCETEATVVCDPSLAIDE